MAMMLSKLARLGALTKNGSSSISKSRSSKSVLVIADSGFREVADFRWYVADVDDGGSRDKMGLVDPNQNLSRRLLRPFWDSVAPSFGSCFGVVGMNLYSIGGGPVRSNPSSDAYMTDITSCIPYAAPDWKWKKIPCNKRAIAQAVVVDEKLYVFGGIYKQQQQCQPTTLPWAEVYDPKNQQWTPLSEPPTFLPQHGLFACYKKIIVLGCSSSTYLLSYNVMEDGWEIIADDFEPLNSVILPVLYNNRLYWVADRVGIYDLHLNRMFEGPILGYFDQDLLESPRNLSYHPFLLHIHADEFLFIWLKHQIICCTRLQIQIEFEKSSSSGGDLCYYPIAHSLSTQDFLVDQDIRFVCGLLLDRTSSFVAAAKENLDWKLEKY